MIEVKNLVKKFGNHVAVDHISFTVDKGRIYGFLGPNGAGKSTTMNIMTGYTGATEGEVIIDGFNILEEPEKAKKCIGYLPELPPLYLEMTVYEYLKFVAELKGIPKNERETKVYEVCELIKLVDVSERLIKNLSKGYKQRVGLAGAVIGFPDIIILDEPMVGLDPQQIIEIRELIKKLSENHTIILSSHILAEIKEICDHVIIISKGKVVASDTPDNLEQVVHGNDVIELEVKADVAGVEAVIEEVEGVESFAIQEDEGVVELVIQSDQKNETICEDLSTAFVQAGIPLRKLVITKVTLEDVFLELTANAGDETEVEAEEEMAQTIEESEGEDDDSDL